MCMIHMHVAVAILSIAILLYCLASLINIVQPEDV